MPQKSILTDDGKEQVAFALILLKDFKCQGEFDPDITLLILGLADYLGVKAEYDKLLSQVPLMKIEPRS